MLFMRLITRLHTVCYENKLHIVRRFSVHNTFNIHKWSYICRIHPTGDKISVFSAERNEFIKTSVLYTTGAWFHSQSDHDIENREIVMGIHNHKNSVLMFYEPYPVHQRYDSYQSHEIFVYKFEVIYGLFTTYHEALFTMSEFGYTGEDSSSGFFGNHVMVRCKQRDGVINTKIYKNYGIIVLSGAILVNNYHPCVENLALNNWLQDNFDNITNNEELLNSENIGFLVYTTPEGKSYRTSNNEIITKFVNDEYYEMFYNCSKISHVYFIGSEKYTLIKNYGIIENGKLVRQSNNLIDNGTAVEYVPDNSVNIKWNKL